MNYIKMDEPAYPKRYSRHAEWVRSQTFNSESFGGRVQEPVLDDVRRSIYKITLSWRYEG
ncbi:hypothetical protein SAMN05720354_11930 [Nitrosospira sp. Nsp1]|nr:hypothetical protein SAMN05720354_11930 [Nitrosospira sp. Nsp1]